MVIVVHVFGFQAMEDRNRTKCVSDHQNNDRINPYCESHSPPTEKLKD